MFCLAGVSGKTVHMPFRNIQPKSEAKLRVCMAGLGLSVPKHVAVKMHALTGSEDVMLF